jgi:hypothetical protein
MPITSQHIQQAINQVRDQQSFFNVLLAKTLEWPVAKTEQIEDIAYGWSQKDLNAAGLEKELVEGSIWQIQPAEQNQPWGIFVLEFKHEDSLSPRRGMAGVLRKVLRGLVMTRRKDPRDPSWKREHLLFICTYKWTHFRFAYFRTKSDEPRVARLATFGWTPDTSNRTVCEFNLPALTWPDDTSDAERWLETWAKAFDKEPLTRDFFRRFDKALDAIKADLESNMDLTSGAAYTESQLLLERLIFLYFLQNRGWLNRDRRYLLAAFHEHAAKPDQYSYYHNFLDKLFWTLATARGSAARLGGIPFLNGGLFDDDEFRQIPNRKTNPPLKVRNHTMQYVFSELLEAFNFTVTEDTPLNQEVAVDPEMLGKVFESIVLHAEAADPDAIAPDKRKATGSYYTPRIVVHFICREAIYQYLLGHLPGKEWGPRLKALLNFEHNDGFDEEEKNLLKRTIAPDQARKVLDLIKPLKCCDPAVGSGAFPVGLMQELVNLRRLLETVLNGYRDPVVSQGSTWLHDTKAHIVENCLFGVDIQQQAIEICRLRLWLTLVVDYDLGLDPFSAEQRQFMEAIERMSQLPNLEMNFRRGDSLHDRISDVPVVILPDRASRHTTEFNAIAKLGADLHKAKKAERKKKLRLDILEKRLELSRKIIQEELQILRQRDSALDRLFGDEESDAEKRQRNRREIERLEQAVAKIETDEKSLEKLRQREADPRFYPTLRKLEGADFDSPFNFAWSIDFPSVFGRESRGFDIIVGNPPFVTARNRTKRELWAERWPRVCYKNYQLVAPFFDLSFNLLTGSGQLGFIVSNAFAKRDFGKPLIERFFPTVELQKVVDCSGLMFPGHGTPTCIIFGRQPTGGLARKDGTVRLSTILPGGGDLRTPPEESPLWQIIERHHDDSGYRDERIEVGDRSFKEMHTWPWRAIGDEMAPQMNVIPLQTLCAEPIGAQFITGKDEAFVVSGNYVRRRGIEISHLKAYGAGEDVRDWHARPTEYIVFPYDAELRPLVEPLPSGLDAHLRPYKAVLENCVISSSIKKKETNLQWFEFRRLARAKFRSRYNIVIPQIATHQHFIVVDHSIAFKEKAQAIALKPELPVELAFLLAAILNSSFFADVLKRECFSKRESNRPEKDTYFEFSGGKLATIGVPATIIENSPAATADALRQLSVRCHDLGSESRGLAFRNLFWRSAEAYEGWNSLLPAGRPRHPELPSPFDDSDELRPAVQGVIEKRQNILRLMIACQEEMDWRVYSVCGLLTPDHPAADGQLNPEAIDSEERPFRIWSRASANYERAVELLPKGWSSGRRRLWETRLAAIRDNEHVRRVEQSIYKRRWDEQWKVGNEWRCGEIAYAAEFVDAFEWWLKEKAEWWLENKKEGGPVDISEWAQALWKDERVQAAWPIAAEQYAFLDHEKVRQKAEDEGDPVPAPPKPATGISGFSRMFKQIIDEETVPTGFPFGTDYDQLAQSLRKAIPSQLKKVRGKLNVPRERFHLDAGQYKWAGLQFRRIASGTAAGDKKP